MPKLQIFLPAVLLLSAFPLGAQSTSATSTPATQDFTFRVSPASSWINTALDLQSGDVLEISASASGADSGAATAISPCDPKGVTATASRPADLPLPGAPMGSLIARLHESGIAPVLVGASTELHVKDASHLFLGMNISGAPPCQGEFVVKVHRIPAGSSTTTAAGTQTGTRGAQLKSQLSGAAQVFLEGQFGVGKSEAGASGATSETGSSGNTPAATVKVSNAPLDSQLSKSLDSVPRRVNDQFNNLGDMVNFVIVGSQKDVQAALEAASWHVADTSNQKAVLNAVMETYDSKDYLAMPMSTLYLFGRKQDFGYEMAEPIAMVASRHHFRIWKAPFAWYGQEVWVGAGTHDIGFAKDKRNNDVTHKIDPAVDGERDNIGSSLQKTNKARTLSYYLPPNPVQDARNATGDVYHSDGRLLVVFLQ
jgi:hypothetical protein